MPSNGLLSSTVIATKRSAGTETARHHGRAVALGCCLAPRPALQCCMPELTRRRYPERPDCWHVYYGDVHVGTIAIRNGNPHDEDPWEWSCGFYPGSLPGEHQSDTAATFEEARADFECAW